MTPAKRKVAELNVLHIAQVARTSTAGAHSIIALAVDEQGEAVMRRAMIADVAVAWDVACDLVRDEERPAVVRVDTNGMVAVYIDDPRVDNGHVFDIDDGPDTPANTEPEAADESELDEALD